MAIEKIVNIIVNESGTDKAIADVNRLESSLDNLESANKNISGSFKESGQSILDNGGAMGILNEVTGGYAMTVKDAVEASGLFTKGTTIATLGQKIYTAVVGTSTGALKAFKIALASTGVGLLVVALGYLVTVMAESGEVTEEAKKQQEDYAKALERSTALLKENTAELDRNTKLALARAKERGASVDELRKIETDAHFEKLAQISAEQEALTKQFELENLTGEAAEKNIKRRQELSKEYSQVFTEGLQRQADERAEDAQRVRDEEKAAAEKLAEANKKRLEEKLAKQREYQKQLLEDLKAFNLAVLAAEDNQFALELERQNEKDAVLKSLRAENALTKLSEDYKTARATLDQANATQQELLDLEVTFEGRRQEILSSQQSTEIEARNAAIENQKLEFETRYAVLEEQRQMILDADNLSEEQRTEALAKNTEARKQLFKEEVAAKLEMSGQLANGLATASKLAGESTAAGKALAVAATTIDTIRGGISAFTGMVQSIPGPVGIALGAVAAAGVVASGYASVKKILAVKTPGGGGGAGGVPSPPTIAAPPQFNVVGQSGTNQLAETINNQQKQDPIQAFVVSTEVSNAQALDRNRIATATFN